MRSSQAERMKKPSPASLKKVTAENLTTLGVDRLAEILVEVAETRADLKRRLRMELAAGLGAEHLVPEIDKRLGAIEASRGQVTWRQKPAFLRDLDAVRGLIADRLGPEQASAALERMWRFLATTTSTSKRLRARDEALDAVYLRAAGDLGHLLAGHDPRLAAEALIDAVAAAPQIWVHWLPETLASVPKTTAKIALDLALARPIAAPGWTPSIRHIADAAGDVDTYRTTYSATALATPATAVEVARRLLLAGRIDDAGGALRLAAPKPKGLLGRLAAPDFDWETAWIDYLEAAGDTAGAQAVRWASFQRTLDVGRAKAFTNRLTGFDDVEAENGALAYAANHGDFQKGLAFLMAWPALAEASRMIQDRTDEVKVEPDQAEAWAGRLRRRFPIAAHALLRKGAATAFKRREFKTCDRLTEEADAIGV
jgi:hypothetical protein